MSVDTELLWWSVKVEVPAIKTIDESVRVQARTRKEAHGIAQKFVRGYYDLPNALEVISHVKLIP
jgi:hypothetical protein